MLLYKYLRRRNASFLILTHGDLKQLRLINMSCRTDREMPLYSTWIELVENCRKVLEEWISKQKKVTQDA